MENEFLYRNSSVFKNDEDEEWVEVHTAVTNTTPESMVDVVINTTPICPNMSNKEFRKEAMRARDIGVELIKRRIKGLIRWDVKEQDRVKTFFARADESTRRVLGDGLPRLLAAMQELVPEKIVRWDSETNRKLSCAVKPDTGNNHAAVCKPDSEKRVIAIYSKFCSSSFGHLSGGCKIKTIIHECTHFTDTFYSVDHVYTDKEMGARIFAANHPEKAIENADNITGYIATFDDELQ
ncbi:M35 family metallo-endopeptidase [Paraburkholderia susongensis]|uniref:Lysine-specific metallo-endopeptidase n=1 Tax=Paraburkholderia susongensis TaxID=1515439 RepID=A0A1X7LSL7_9BURK|nr:M35 family metallo-endopeptidase [Paraburkholderia susongensis]SMG56252.1 Lysine-specific metallo-endopeptidase [Paraburkholderia susongensis]